MSIAIITETHVSYGYRHRTATPAEAAGWLEHAGSRGHRFRSLADAWHWAFVRELDEETGDYLLVNTRSSRAPIVALSPWWLVTHTEPGSEPMVFKTLRPWRIWLYLVAFPGARVVEEDHALCVGAGVYTFERAEQGDDRLSGVDRMIVEDAWDDIREEMAWNDWAE